MKCSRKYLRRVRLIPWEEGEGMTSEDPKHISKHSPVTNSYLLSVQTSEASWSSTPMSASQSSSKSSPKLPTIIWDIFSKLKACIIEHILAAFNLSFSPKLKSTLVISAFGLAFYSVAHCHTKRNRGFVTDEKRQNESPWKNCANKLSKYYIHNVECLKIDYLICFFLNYWLGTDDMTPYSH